MTPAGGRLAAPLGTIVYGLALATVWVLLWGDLSAANVVSGVAVAAALMLWLVPVQRRRAQILSFRPAAAVRLALFLLQQLAVSNLTLIREILSPRSRLRIGVVAVPVTDCSEQVVTTLANFIALAPGSMPIELRDDEQVLYVHVLHVHDVQQVKRQLWHLRDLTVRAIGSSQAIAALEPCP